MRNIKILIALGCVLNAGFSYSAQIDSLPIDELRKRAVSNSLELQTDQWMLEQSYEDLQVDWLDNAEITADAVTTQQLDETTTDEDDTVVTVKAEVDLSSKISISAQTDTDQETLFGITYSPFASDYVSAADRELYQLAKLEADFDQKDLIYDLDKALLTLAKYQKTVAIAQEYVELTQSLEDSERGSFSLGMSSLSDVADASQERVTAEQELYSAQVNLLDAQQSLFELLGAEEELPEVSESQLAQLVTYRAQQLNELSIADIDSKELQQAQIEHTTLASEMSDVGFYNSDLSFSGEYDVNDNAMELSASFSFSQSQFGSSTLLDLNQELQLKTTESIMQERQLENSYRLLQQKISSLEAALKSQLLAQRLYEEDLNDALVLQEEGERTSLQVAQQRYLKNAADAGVYSALVALYIAQNEFSALWP